MSDIYRDGSEGAAARREHLLRRRRDELATLPHAVRRVVVARSARIGASVAVATLGAALIALAAWPAATERLAAVLPNKPAILTSLLAASWLVGVFAWWVSRARCEHRFAVAMSRHVLPGTNLDADLERLDHEHPDVLARAMAHRLEIRSAALPVLASALVVPATAVYLDTLRHASGWPTVSAIEAGLADRAGTLAAIAVVGAIVALLTTRPALRRGRGIGAALAIAVLGGPAALLASAAGLPGVAWELVAVFAVTLPLAIVNAQLGRERAAIEASDPAAGSEVLTLRALLHGVRVRAAAVYGWLRAARRRQVGWSHGAVLLAAGVGSVVFVASSRHTQGPEPARPSVERSHVAGAALDAGYQVRPTDGGELEVAVGLQANQAVEVALYDELPTVPRGWRAVLTVSADVAGLWVSAVGAPEQPLYAGQPAVVTIDGCADPRPPLALHIHNATRKAAYVAGDFRVHVAPELRAAKCD